MSVLTGKDSKAKLRPGQRREHGRNVRAALLFVSPWIFGMLVFTAWPILKIGVPLCKPALIVTLVFEFQTAWTDLMGPLIYLRDSSTFTVPRGLKALVDQFGVSGEFAWEIPITAGVITTIPMIILFFIAQKHFIKGVATTGMKG